MAVHLDVDLGTLSFTDTSRKFVTERSGTLTGSYRSKNWTFAASMGEKDAVIAVQARAVDYTNGFTYSGGIRYDAGPRFWLIVGFGQDVGASATVVHGVDLQHYIRADANFRLL